MKSKLCIHVILAGTLLAGLIGCQEKGPPYLPEKALDTFELPEGYRIELVAGEPLIADPVDIAFDADGRLYVVEMPDYPTDEDRDPHSRIVLLEDRNSDGKFDTRTVFAEDLPFVNGVMPWRNGILATRAPDILYFEDTTGDGHADLRRVVLTGFAVTNPQLRVSSLRYGIDNWIYAAYSRASAGRGFPEHADSGRPLHFPENTSAESADIYPGTNFRFRPLEYKVEPSGGMSQFGLSFDAEGNQFTVWNNDHLRHVVIDQKYVTRNPFLSISSVMASIPEHSGQARVYPITADRLDLHESEIGHFTSACGHTIYTGNSFAKNYQGAAFVCEPVSNLVHVDLIAPRGATFTAKRAFDEAEFLASTDSWFRPVNTRVGPDGNLYVVDMYRKLIEHPAWIANSDEEGYHTYAGVLKESDFHEGQGKGRIYRIVPAHFRQGDSEKPSLDTADTRTLVGHLTNPNMWWRITAQRLLVEREDTSAVPALEKLATGSSYAEGKIHALWTLEGLNSLDDRLVLAALGDESPIVRSHAVLLAEERFTNREFEQKLLAMGGDPDDHVQFKVALALSALPPERSFDTLEQIARQHIDDSWFRKAILLSVSENALQWFQAVSRFNAADREKLQGKKDFLNRIASIVGTRYESREISELLSFIIEGNDTGFSVASLEGLGEGMQRGTGQLRLTREGQANLMASITAGPSKMSNAALDIAAQIDIMNSQDVKSAVERAANIALDDQAATEARTHATRVLGIDPGGLHTDIFDQLLKPGQPMDVQMAAAGVLLNSDDSLTIQLLLGRWSTYTSAVRRKVEKGIVGRRPHATYLMDAIEKGAIKHSWLSRSTMRSLIRHSDEGIRQRAEAEFGELLEENRDEIVTEYYQATTIDGDISNGKEIFKQTCSICHQAGADMGNAVGPDLRSVSNWTRINLLTKILKPNDYITAGYEGYVIGTTDGRTITGVMVQETSASVILHAPGGVEHTIAREKIESARPMAYSLMPQGLESKMSIQEMADLIEFIKNLQ